VNVERYGLLAPVGVLAHGRVMFAQAMGHLAGGKGLRVRELSDTLHVTVGVESDREGDVCHRL
jgi:hypothetical protein